MRFPDTSRAAPTDFWVEREARLRLRCRVDGAEGRPWIVFSNSLATDLTLWDGQVGAFRDAYRVLRYDQRGHGASSAAAATCDFAALVSDLLAIFDAFGVREATLVGVSIGAVTALRFAALHAERLRGVVACDGQVKSPPGARDAWEPRIATAKRHGMPPLVEPTIQRWFTSATLAAAPPWLDKVRGMIRATSPAGYVGCARALLEYDHGGDLPGLAIPVLYVVGEADGALPGTMREMHAATPGSGFVAIPDAGHLPPVEAPGRFNQVLREFLARPVPSCGGAG